MPEDRSSSAPAVVVVVFAVIALATALTPRAVAGQDRVRAGVDLVALDVCVRPRNGSSAAELKPDDLLVLDNDARQTIVLFSGEGRIPLAVTLLVDNSQSMHGGLLEHARIASQALIDSLGPDDLVEVVSFNDHARIRYPMGPNHAEAKAGLGDMSAIGATALFESVLVAVNNHERARTKRIREYREVVVVLSDGENTAGRVTFEEMLDRVRRSSVLIYTVSLPGHDHDRPEAAPPWQMSQMAIDSGGEAIAVHHADDLTRIYQDIARDLEHLYRVGYVPSPLVRDGSWHRIAVSAPAMDVIARTRAGYYAP